MTIAFSYIVSSSFLGNINLKKREKMNEYCSDDELCVEDFFVIAHCTSNFSNPKKHVMYFV